MFTIEQIKAAHSNVKSGADFPKYIKDIKQLGVTAYTTYVSDGHSLYEGKDSYSAASPAKYTELSISAQANIPQFSAGLREHQQGKTNYMTFCETCAMCGVEKWIVSIDDMTCTYYDKAGNKLLVETIPGLG